MNYSMIISEYVRNTVIYFVESTQLVFQVLTVGGVDVCTCTYWCCSVPQLCPTLCDPVDCSTSDFPVLHYLPEFAQIHVH